MAEETKTKRVFYAERTLDTSKMSVVFAFTDGEVMAFNASDFPESIARHALLAGINTRLGQGMNKAESLTDAKQAVKDAVEQLKAGDWSRGPQANPATRLVDAYVQLAKEQNKVVTAKAIKEQIAAKEKETPGFAAAKMAEEKFQSAYMRSQAATSASLDDLG